MVVRRISARRKLWKHQDVWPINPAAGKTPDGWPGWPDGKKFAVVLTHDVEGSIGLAKCQQLMQLEQELGFRSSFNLIPEGDEYIASRQLRDTLVQNGFEVGVHDLYHNGKLLWTREDFRRSASQINRYLKDWDACGFRAGFMLRNLDWFHDLNIQYDASTFDTDPFEPQPDGANTIFPFWVPRPLNSENRESRIENRESEGGNRASGHQPDSGQSQISNLKSPSSESLDPKLQPSSFSLHTSGYAELPYTLPQDSTLFLVLKQRSIDIWKRKIDWIAKHGGMMLVNVHPDYLQFPGTPASPQTYPVAHYIQLLEYVRNRYAGGYWQPVAREVATLVSQRQQCNHAGRINTLSAPEAVRECEPVFMASAESAQGSAITVAPTACAATQSSPAGNCLDKTRLAASNSQTGGVGKPPRLVGKRVGVLLFSHYPSDPRPKRAAEAMAREGAAVDFLCLRRNSSEPIHEAVNGLNIFRVSLKRQRGGKLVYVLQYGVFISVGFLFLAWRSLRRRYHLIHVHNMPDVLVFGALIPKLLGAKVILDLHDPMPELMTTIFKLTEQSLAVRFLKQTEKWSIAFADLVLTPNIAFKNLFAARSCPSDKIQIVMNSPNEETFQFRPVSSVAAPRSATDPFVVLYHGSLVYRHGLDIAIDALALVRKTIPNATITICGENTPYFENVMEFVKARGLTDAVHYLGMRNQQQIAAAIEQCHLGVIPNRRSVFIEINMPTRIFEYLALAKPVIAPNTRGIQDYFSEADLLFFEPDNVADLAAKMLWAFQHPEEIALQVRRGQAVYLQHRWSSQKERLVTSAVSLTNRR